MPTFPPDFVWGVATSSYQIEGAVDADGRGPSIWDTFSHTAGRTHAGDTGDVADDHYHRWRQDLDLMASLGVDAYRFSVAWPRVQPDGIRVEPRGLDFYDRLVDGLLDRGVEPVVTLYHWDLPQALQDAGGWPARDTAARFGEYAAVVAERLGDRVRRWLTVNEPWCAAFLGYAEGVHAPGERDPQRAVAAAHHLLLAHGRAVQALRASVAAAELGIVVNPAPVRPLDDAERDAAAVTFVDGIRNRLWLDPVVHGRYPEDVLAGWSHLDLSVLRDDDLSVIAAPIDVLGVNYYAPMYVGVGDGPEPDGVGVGDFREGAGPGPYTAMGWPIDPDGLEELLVRLARDYGLPLVVTENGAAFDDELRADGTVDDIDRIAYLDGHLRACHRALERGVDLRGYFLWTLLDNFEWAEGYRRRFGIVFVDRERDLARIPKRSAAWYRAVTGSNGLPELPSPT